MRTTEERKIIADNQQKLDQAVSKNLWGMDYEFAYEQALKKLGIKEFDEPSSSRYLQDFFKQNDDALNQADTDFKGIYSTLNGRHIFSSEQDIDIKIKGVTERQKSLQNFINRCILPEDITRIRNNYRSWKRNISKKTVRHEISMDAQYKLTALAESLGKNKRDTLEFLILNSSIVE